MIRARLLLAFAMLIGLCAAMPLQGGHVAATAMGGLEESDRAAQNALGKRTVPPLAFVRFCRTHTASCAVRAGSLPSRDGRLVLTSQLFASLGETNRLINRSLRIRKDVPGRDVWSVNTLKGDCEDFALAKRARLLALGWPSSAVSVAVVRTAQGAGHAVLIARTTQGDFVLDNLHAEILPPARTGYHFLSMQDGTRAIGWVAL